MAVAQGQPGSEQNPQDLVYIDELTGLYNRRFYSVRLPQEIAKARQINAPLAVAVLDVDFFKSINDNYGHHEGDRVLVQVGQLLAASCKPYGAIPIRYGGDEFFVLMPGFQRADAVKLLERISAETGSNPFQMSDGKVISLTLSVGVASAPEDVKDPEKLFDAADGALYISKKEGRNRVSTPDSKSKISFSRDNFHRLFPCPRLIGRADILSQIKPHLVLRAGVERPIVVLEGPSGVGKTRLLEACQAATDPQRSVIIPARGQPYLVNQPYGTLLEALRYMTRFDAKLAHRMAAALTPREIRAIYPLLPDVAGLSMFAAEGTDGADFSEEGTRKVITAAMVKILIAVADGKPLTIFVDDLQWSEAGTVEVLEQLKASEEGKSALIMCALRKTGEVAGEGHKSVLDFVVTAMKNRLLLPLEIEPLSYHHVREMIGAIIQGLDMNARLVQIVTQKSQALPLLVEEILKFLIQQEYITCRSGAVEVRDFTESDIPAKIQEILVLRSQNMDVELRGVVSKAAVVGQTFDLNTLKEIEGRNEGELLEAIDKGVRASFLLPGGADEFRFASDNAAEAMYNQIDKKEQKRVHAKVADLEERRLGNRIDAGVGKLAFHHEKAGNIERAMGILSRLERYEQQPVGIAAAPKLGTGFVQQIGDNINVLVKDLESGSNQKIAAAAEVLMKKGEQSIDPLVGLIGGTDDLRARRVALHLLHRLGTGVLHRLLEELHKRQDYQEKCRFIATLGEYQDPRIATHLEPFIRFPEATVRREAIRVIENMATKEVYDLFFAAIRDKNEDVQQDAIAAVARLGKKLENHDAVPVLCKMIRKRTIFFFDRHKNAQRAACQALGVLKDGAAPRFLRDALRDWRWSIFWTKHEEVRQAAAMALTSYPGRETEQALERASHDRNHVVRSAAKIALTKLRGDKIEDDFKDIGPPDAGADAGLLAAIGATAPAGKSPPPFN
jgi:diguanylate cyclase (GGDEF)-like protein